MLIRLEAGESRPLHRQVYDRLRRAILDGELDAGHRLPSSRDLARELAVSRNVVVIAYEQLLAEGYVESRVGAGTFVAAPPPELATAPGRKKGRRARKRPSQKRHRPAPRLAGFAERALAQRPFNPKPRRSRPPSYDFRYGGGQPDAQGLKAWRRLVTRHADQLCFDYAPIDGLAALREQIVRYARASRGVRCDLDQVVVVNGSQQGLDLVGRMLLEPGDRVVVEEPGYQGACKAFRAAGAELVPGRVDEEGLDVDAVASAAARARLVYVTPSHQFPAGAVMSIHRRLKLLEWAVANGAYILEDDYDSEFRYEGRPVEAVQGLDRHGRTIYVATLSKVLSPTLRLGYLVVPKTLIEAVKAVKWLADRHTPALEQAALADFMAEGHFERHLRRMRTRNAERRAALMAALDTHLGDRVRVTGTNAGVHLLVWLRGVAPARLDALIERAAEEEDVGVYSCAPYFLEPPEEAGLVLGYSTLSAVEIEEGIRRLGRLLERGA